MEDSQKTFGYSARISGNEQVQDTENNQPFRLPGVEKDKRVAAMHKKMGLHGNQGTPQLDQYEFQGVHNLLNNERQNYIQPNPDPFRITSTGDAQRLNKYVEAHPIVQPLMWGDDWTRWNRPECTFFKFNSFFYFLFFSCCFFMTSSVFDKFSKSKPKKSNKQHSMAGNESDLRNAKKIEIQANPSDAQPEKVESNVGQRSGDENNETPAEQGVDVDGGTQREQFEYLIKELEHRTKKFYKTKYKKRYKKLQTKEVAKPIIPSAIQEIGDANSYYGRQPVYTHTRNKIFGNN